MCLLGMCLFCAQARVRLHAGVSEPGRGGARRLHPGDAAVPLLRAAVDGVGAAGGVGREGGARTPPLPPGAPRVLAPPQACVRVFACARACRDMQGTPV